MNRFLAIGTFLLWFGWNAPALSQEVNEPTPQTPSVEQLFSEEVQEVQGGSPVRRQQLAEKERRRAVEILVPMLKHENANKRFLAALALKHRAAQSDIRFLSKTVRTETHEEAQIALIDVLSQFEDPLVIETLQFVGNRASPPVQLAIIDAFGKLRSEAGIPILGNILLNTELLELRKRAASALALIGGSQAEANLNDAILTLPEGGPKRSAAFAHAVLTKKISLDRTDEEIPEGSKVILFQRGLLYYYYKPSPMRNQPSAPWTLVCVHGEELNVEETFDLCQPIAKQYRVALVAPLFDNLRFPDYETLNVRGERSDKRLLELLDHLTKTANIKTREIYLFGAGSGGEFVQRFTLAHPKRIARSAFHTSEYVEPSFDTYYPTGLLESPLAPGLKFDLYTIVKTDFAALVQKKSDSARGFDRFFQGLANFADSQSILVRARRRFLPDGELTLKGIWENAHQYLFPSN